MASWSEQFRSLGQALLEVVRAELAELQGELAVTGRQLGIALGLFAAAAVVGFWTVAALIYFLIHLLALWLPLWAAAGVVMLLLLAAIALLGWLGYRRLQRVENPAETVRRRLDDHQDWWRHRMLPQENGPRAAGSDEEEEEP